MKKLIGISAFLLLGLSDIQTASAKIYTCIVNGETVYTSKRTANCHEADLPSIGRYSSSRYGRPQTGQSKAEAPKQQAVKKAPVYRRQTAAAPVQVKASPQPAVPKQAGSNSRRSILEQELANERKALTEAQQSLASARAAKNGSINQQHITQLQGSVLDRQQNIQALQRELGRM